MRKLSILTVTAGLLAVLAGAMLSGCVNASVTQESPPAAAASAPPNDGRSMSDLRRENAALRQQLDKLEKDNRGWAASNNQAEDQLRDLKRQRDDVKKQRDQAKKAAKSG